MNSGSALLLVAAVGTVGVLHTIVPDHWVPITLIARQRGWSKSETAKAALLAGSGHILSTLLIAVVVWLAGVAFAERFGHVVDTVSSLALIAFGGWFAISAWRDLRKHGGHGHSHSHDFPHLHENDKSTHPSHVHGPELKRISTEEAFLEDDHGHHEHGHDHGHDHDHETAPEDDPLYAPLRGETAVLTRHVHAHRHGRGTVHRHWHDHTPASAHLIIAETETSPPAHDHRHKTTARTALLLILGSSPMVEGIPAFFAAGKYGIGLIVVMAVVFAMSTIATYVLLSVYSTAGLQRVRLGAFERYGEVLSGAFIALVGLAFWIWPVL
jgi:ABC-type nickel/cobalt efflux system permease component RcnA